MAEDLRQKDGREFALLRSVSTLSSASACNRRVRPASSRQSEAGGLAPRRSLERSRAARRVSRLVAVVREGEPVLTSYCALSNGARIVDGGLGYFGILSSDLSARCFEIFFMTLPRATNPMNENLHGLRKQTLPLQLSQTQLHVQYYLL